MLLAAVPARAQEPSAVNSDDSPEEVYLTIRYASVVDDHLPAWYYEGEVYVALGALFDLLHVDYEFDAGRQRLHGFYLQDENTYELEFKRGHAVVGGRTIQLQSSEYLPGESDVFVRPDLLDRLFGLTLTFDMSRLALHLETEQDLPVKKAAERRRNRINLHDPQSSFRQAPLLYPRRRKWLGIGQMDYSLSTGFSNGELVQAAAVRAGIEVLGGDLRWNASGSAAPFRLSRSEFQWRYVLGANPWLTRVEAGTLGSTGMRALRYDGISITNEPIEVRSLLVANYDIAGVTQPNWEVELYLNGRLVEFGRADPAGHYKFTIPLPYGTSDVRLVHYGAAGEVVPERRRLEIPYSFLPPGETSYTLHAGRTTAEGPASSHRRSLVQGHGSVGLTSRVTARMGVDYLSNDLHNPPVVYGGISTRLGSHFLINLRGASSSHVNVALNGNFPTRTALHLRYARRSDERIPDLLNNWKEQIQVAGYAPLGPLPMSARLSATRERFASWNQYAVRGQLAARLANIQLRTDVRASAQERGGRMDAKDVIVSPSLVSSLPSRFGPFGGASLRAHMQIDATDWTAAGMGMELFTGSFGAGQLRLTIDRNVRSRRTVFGLRFTYDLPAARMNTSAQFVGGTAVILQTTRGSVGMGDGLVVGNRESVGRAAASVRMFVDENSNGRRDAGEQWVEGAMVRVAETGRVRRADSVTVHVLDLHPYARYNLSVVESSIRNPLWVPQHAWFSFVADPNAFKEIDIPLYAAGAVEGTVTREEGGREVPVPGARVQLFRADGTLQEVLTTFSDGTFYSITLPPGDYEARLDSAQLVRAGLEGGSAAIAFAVEPTSDGAFVDGLSFALVERGGGAAQAGMPIDDGMLAESHTPVDDDPLTESLADAAVPRASADDGAAADRFQDGVAHRTDAANDRRLREGAGHIYVVQPTDIGLMDIARKVYDDGYLWPAIYWANRDVLEDPDRIEPGQRLKIPNRRDGWAREVWTYYQVSRSDIGLMDISRKLYRDGYLWPKIWLENRDQVPDPDLIHPGQRLEIPHKAQLTETDRAALYEQASWGTYTVRSAIGLMEVARRVYGDGFLWPKIYLANRARLEGPHLVHRGQRLRIPPKAPLTEEERSVLEKFRGD